MDRPEPPPIQSSPATTHTRPVSSNSAPTASLKESSVVSVQSSGGNARQPSLTETEHSQPNSLLPSLITTTLLDASAVAQQGRGPSTKSYPSSSPVLNPQAMVPIQFLSLRKWRCVNFENADIPEVTDRIERMQISSSPTVQVQAQESEDQHGQRRSEFEHQVHELLHRIQRVRIEAGEDTERPKEKNAWELFDDIVRPTKGQWNFDRFM